MRRPGRLATLVVALVVALAAAACVEPLPEDAADGSPATSSPDASDPTAPGDDPPADDDGTEGETPGPGIEAEPLRPDLSPLLTDALAQIGGRWGLSRGHEVAVVDLATMLETVVDGGGPVVGQDSDGQGSVAATQPSWSDDGLRLAWSTASIDGSAPAQVRWNDGSVPWDAATHAGADLPAAPAFYLHWGADAVLALAASADGQRLTTFYVDAEERALPVAEGAPTALSWSPDGSRALIGTDLASVGLFDPATGRAAVDPLVATGARFSVPAWTDDRTFVVRVGDRLVRMSAAGEELTELARLDGPMRMVATADGSKIAFAGFLEGEDTSLANPPLRILDVTEGDLTTVTESLVAAWEWSADGTRLAYLADASVERISTVSFQTSRDDDGADPDDAPGSDQPGGDEPGGDDPAEEPGEPDAGPGAIADPLQLLLSGQELRWHFFVDGALQSATSPFVPTAVDAGSYLPFFQQYAVSHARWSPDGQAFAFAGTVDADGAGSDGDGTGDSSEATSGAHVHFVDTLAESFWVTPADVVFWSPNGGGGAGDSPA